MSEFIIKDRRFKVLTLKVGDAYYADDLNVYNMDRAKSIKHRIENDGYNFDDWHMGTSGVIGEGDYVVLRPIKEPEVNEFGEVSP